MPAEQRLELSRLEPERRAALAFLEEEESGKPAPGREQLSRALHVARPKRAWQRTQECPLVDQVEGRAEIGFEEIRQPHPLRERPEGLFRPLYRCRGKIDREHVVSRPGKGAHLVARAAARDQHAQSPRLGFEKPLERRGNPSGIPGGEILAKALFPELGLRSVLPGHRPQPFTQTICFSVCTTSTRSVWSAITRSMSLYAPGISSSTPLSLRHSTPWV